MQKKTITCVMWIIVNNKKVLHMKGLWELTPVWVLIHWALHCGTLEIHKQSYYGAVLALAFSCATPRMSHTSACMTGYIRIYIYIIFWSNSASWNSVSQSMTEVKDETALIPVDLTESSEQASLFQTQFKKAMALRLRNKSNIETSMLTVWRKRGF